MTESHDGGTAVGRYYCYDARDQLVARNTGAGCDVGSDEAYTYDAAGNRITATGASGSRSFGYSADGQYTGAVHDAAGRFTEWDNWRFLDYDADGRLTEVCDIVCSSGSQRYFFRYDADGRRTSITSAGGWQSTTTELRYVDGRISAEYTSTCDVNGCTTPVLSRSYVTDESGAVVKMVIPAGPNAGTYLVTWNGHGDALNLLHLDGGALTLANSFSYDTWGSATVHTHNGFVDLGFRFRYVGQHGVQDDAVDGLPLLLMGGRHYSSDLGRFIQPDPAALEENHYGYAQNNPATMVDPDGTFAFAIPVVWWVAGAVAAVTTTWVATDTIPRVQQITVGRSYMTPIGDQLANGVLNLAQSLRKKLASLRNAEAELTRKIRNQPNARARNHWERNREGIRRKIDNLLRRNRGLR